MVDCLGCAFIFEYNKNKSKYISMIIRYVKRNVADCLGCAFIFEYI